MTPREFTSACLEAGKAYAQPSGELYYVDQLHAVATARGHASWDDLRAALGMEPAPRGVVHMVRGRSVRKRPQVTTLAMSADLCRSWYLPMADVAVADAIPYGITLDGDERSIDVEIREHVDQGRTPFLVRRAQEGFLQLVPGIAEETLPLRAFVVLAMISGQLPSRFAAHHAAWKDVAFALTWRADTGWVGQEPGMRWYSDAQLVARRWEIEVYRAMAPGAVPPRGWQPSVDLRPDGHSLSGSDEAALVSFIERHSPPADAGEGRRMVEAYQRRRPFTPARRIAEANAREKRRRTTEAAAFALPADLHLAL